ncbi:MAG: ABC transporter permease [Candidatus Bruticola sp.]
MRRHCYFTFGHAFIDMYRIVFAFLCKDLKDALRSHSLLFVLLGPVLVTVFFAKVMDSGDSVFVKVGVCGRVDSGLVNCMKLLGGCSIEKSDHWEELCRKVKDRQLTMAVNIDANFDEDIYCGAYPVLEICLDESSLAKSMAARELVRTALRQMAGQDIPSDIRVTKFNAFEGNISLVFIPIWMVFTCLGALSVASSTLAEEIENKTLDAVLLAPVSWVEILSGKVLCGFVLASVSTFLVALLSGGQVGGFLPLVALIGTGSLLFSLAGIVLGLLVKSQSACGALNSLIYLMLIMPVSMSDYNELMRSISYVLPSWYLNDGFNKIMFASGSWPDLRINFLCLGAELILLTAVGVWSLRRIRTSE